MGNIAVDIMPPTNWQDFERLTLDWAKKAWKDAYAKRNGREGQSQGGVDVYGYHNDQKENTAVQCKKRTWATKPGADAPSNTLTTAEIDEEVAKAITFNPRPHRFIIATTGPRDEPLQEYVRTLNAGSPTMKISLMFWDDFVHDLNNDPDLMFLYYENVLKYRKSYTPDEHFFRLVRMAFDRPALRTPIRSENESADLNEALTHTCNTISTGRLIDRNGEVIDQAPKPKSLPTDLTNASRKLDKARTLVTKGRSQGTVSDQGGWVFVRDHKLAQEIDTLRLEAIDLLNKVLVDKGLETLSP